MRIHLYGSIAVPTIPRLTVCAFNQTIIKYAAALKEAGHEVFFYGTAEYEKELSPFCAHFILGSTLELFKPLICPKAFRRRFPYIGSEHFSKIKAGFEPVMWKPEVDTDRMSFSELETRMIEALSYGPYLSNLLSKECMEIVWAIREDVQKMMNSISYYIQPRDLILTFWDIYNKLFPKWEKKGAIVVEGLVQYESSNTSPRFNRSIFSSIFQQNLRREKDGRDGQHQCVIPPFFFPSDFIFNPSPRNSKGPYLYLGRVQPCKGAGLFMQLVEYFSEHIFWMAGPGNFQDGTLILERTWDLSKYPNLKYWGIADKKLRASLLSQSTALIQPSQYDEPFGWNVVEANLCGTPAITTDRGAFKETVVEGLNGYRLHENETWERCQEKMENCAQLSPSTIYERAVSIYSKEAVISQYVKCLKEIQARPGPLFIPN